MSSVASGRRLGHLVATHSPETLINWPGHIEALVESSLHQCDAGHGRGSSSCNGEIMNLSVRDSTVTPFDRTENEGLNFTESVKSSSGTSYLDSILANIYFYLTVIMSTLSLIGCFVIFGVYLRFKELRVTGLRLLVYLSIADSLTALGNVAGIIWYLQKDGMSENSAKIFCEAHATLTFFSSVSSFLWTVAIAVHLYACIVKMNAPFADKCEPIFHLVCWLVPGK